MARAAEISAFSVRVMTPGLGHGFAVMISHTPCYKLFYPSGLSKVHTGLVDFLIEQLNAHAVVKSIIDNLQAVHEQIIFSLFLELSEIPGNVRIGDECNGSLFILCEPVGIP